MEKQFIHFVGPLVRSTWGNIAILVVADAFSKFVTFFPVRKINSRAVLECLERSFFPMYGVPKYLVTDNAHGCFLPFERLSGSRSPREAGFSR